MISTATVSTAVTTGRPIRGAAFFTGARFGLALATAAFAREDLRAFPRVTEFTLRSFPRFSTFDFFLRLAMVHPLFWLVLANTLCRIKTQTANPTARLS
jgi:hypothetical protein